MKAEAIPCVVTDAAQWMATLRDECASDADREACLRWRAADPEHERVYRRLEDLWGSFDRAAAFDSPAAARRILEQADRKPRTGRRALGAAALALLVCGAGLWRMAPPAWLLADHRSGVGEWRVIELDDHSRITLNSDSAIDVRFDARQRLITLRQGEILVDVAHEDAGRPFVVQTPDGTAQALGTRYAVRRGDGHTDVVVQESRVRACAQAPAPVCADLAAGQRVRMGAGQVGEVEPVDAEQALAWTRHSLVVDNQPLADVLAELSRYRKGRLQYDAGSLDGLRVSGVFPLEAPDQALASLAASLPVTVNRYTSWLVLVQRR